MEPVHVLHGPVPVLVCKQMKTTQYATEEVKGGRVVGTLARLILRLALK